MKLDGLHTKTLTNNIHC